MATNNRDPYYITIGTGTSVLCQFDKDIYSATIAPILGLLATKPAGDSFRLSQKAALKTGKVARLRATVYRDVPTADGTVTKSRQIPLLCDLEKVDEAMSQLKDKTVKLGDAGNTWTIGSVTLG